MPLDPAAIRLLLLDLDDTLFDCAGTLVPAAHRDAVAAMVAAGLPHPAADRLAELHDLLAGAAGGVEVYTHLAARHGCGPQVVAAGHRAFFERDVPPIDPFPGVREALDGWAGRFERVIVTFGDPATQARKVERLAIAPHVDAVRYVGRDTAGGKEAAFRDELASRSLGPEAALVVGNRLDDEIAAGNRLGCPTVLVAGGEFAGQTPSGPEQEPALRIGAFCELVGALAR